MTPDGNNPKLLVKVGLPIILVGLVAATGLLMGCWLRPHEESKPEEKTALITLPSDLFKGWKKPDAVIILAGQRHGYVLPCGCSSPQVGGVERLYNLVQAIKEH